MNKRQVESFKGQQLSVFFNNQTSVSGMLECVDDNGIVTINTDLKKAGIGNTQLLHYIAVDDIAYLRRTVR